jgi:Transglutaminase-like superfamily
MNTWTSAWRSALTHIPAAFVLLTISIVLVKARYLAPTLALLARVPPRTPNKDDEDFVSSVCYTVNRATALWPTEVLCLQRSLSIALALRLGGIRSDLVIGVRPYPVEGHAWVEVNGRVISDDPAVCSNYVRI